MSAGETLCVPGHPAYKPRESDLACIIWLSRVKYLASTISSETPYLDAVRTFDWLSER
jgi:hypothetical protein